MIWYDMIRYDTIRYDTIRYDTIRYTYIPEFLLREKALHQVGQLTWSTLNMHCFYVRSATLPAAYDLILQCKMWLDTFFNTKFMYWSNCTKWWLSRVMNSDSVELQDEILLRPGSDAARESLWQIWQPIATQLQTYLWLQSTPRVWGYPKLSFPIRRNAAFFGGVMIISKLYISDHTTIRYNEHVKAQRVPLSCWRDVSEGHPLKHLKTN